MGMAKMLLACTEVLDTRIEKAAKLSYNVSSRVALHSLERPDTETLLRVVRK